jgi:hypothetical protein
MRVFFTFNSFSNPKKMICTWCDRAKTKFREFSFSAAPAEHTPRCEPKFYANSRGGANAGTEKRETRRSWEF